MKKKYFREHRGSYADSMATMKEVSSVADIIEHYENDPIMKNYLRNIRIDPSTQREHRTKGDEWGFLTYMVVADFDGYTCQCIGYSNFK